MKRMMRWMPLLVWTLGACVDVPGPGTPEPGTPSLLFAGRHIDPLRWESPGVPTLRWRAAAVSAEFAPLGNGQAAFWAVPGQARSLELEYQESDGSWHRWLRLDTPAGALPGLAADSVLVTVRPDPTRFLIDLAPTGLQFQSSSPAHLTWWYDGANADFNHDGTVNLFDRILERALVIRVQPAPGALWSLVGSTLSLLDRRLDADLGHFSGYAVAW
jgi:hypothetical protein